MPVIDRDRRAREEAQCFCESKSNYPKNCNTYKPTLDELRATTFTDYVRKVVLNGAQRDEYIDESTVTDSILLDTPPIVYTEGMAKITLPEGFCDISCVGGDQTGRGPHWQAGTKLGDMVIPSPIKQCLRGIGGIYEYTFLDQPEITVAEFRERADEYYRAQVGDRELSIDMLERKFWKRLGPTMPPSMYGADMEGTLFHKNDDCHGWNISKLKSCLELLLSDLPDDHEGGIPGVTTPYLYVGMWAAVFCAHAEDMNLLSINYMHAGAPKVWYAVAPGEDSKRLEQFCEGHYHIARSQCSEYLRHKRSLISPHMLKKAGIPFSKTIQYPGDAVITFPAGYHFGFNTGFNVAEATNFAVPEWIAYGKLADVCLCRPDSVRIDMTKFERLWLRFEKDRKRSSRLTWRHWAKKQAQKAARSENVSPKKRKSPTSSKSKAEAIQKAAKKKEPFWIEVMQPLSSAAKLKSKKKKTNTRKRQSNNDDDDNDDSKEVWHLAKPISRKSMRPNTKVLCILPATVVNDKSSSSSSVGDDDDDDDDDDEQCFSGVITEVSQEYARIRLDGLTKKDDTWMFVDSPKLFLDGGIWEETSAKGKLPPLHYWQEIDSKRRCS